jgi:short-subunit dehydrogenase
MNILVLGATSVIGADLASEFAPGNRLLLVGRDTARLGRVVRRCSAQGAVEAIALRLDLSRGAAEFRELIRANSVDLLINAASATSRARDQDIDSDQLGARVTADLIAPIELIRRLSEQPGARAPRVIFVSSILALLPSPHRRIYGSLKCLHERSLNQLENEYPEIQPLVVRVARWIDRDSSTRSSRGLARKVRQAYETNRKTLIYGTPGLLLAASYYVHPLVFRLLIGAVNSVRATFHSNRKASVGHPERDSQYAVMEQNRCK